MTNSNDAPKLANLRPERGVLFTREPTRSGKAGYLATPAVLDDDPHGGVARQFEAWQADHDGADS